MCAKTAAFFCAVTSLACGSADGSSADAGAAPDAFVDVPAESETGSDVRCATDQECNDDPAISSLAGRCFAGLCFCLPSFYVQKSGRCGSGVPPACVEQGGECQGSATCSAGTMEGIVPPNQACGDAGTAVCCLPDATCRGHSAFICCSVDSVAHAPVCVNGWRTCPHGFVATRGTSCN